LPQGDPTKMNFGSGGDTGAKVWRDIWGCGQGIGALKEVVSAARLVDRLEREYREAQDSLQKKFQSAHFRHPA
jgi:nitronate monooxygenase